MRAGVRWGACALATLAAGVLASGCATGLPARPAGGLASATIAAAGDGFELAARVAVSEGSRGESFRLIWTREPQAADAAKPDAVRSTHAADVLTAVGTHVARLTVTAAGATLDRGNGVVETAADEAALFERLFGFSLTLDVVAGWLHPGQPSPKDAAGWQVESERDASGRVQRLTASRQTAGPDGRGSSMRVRVVVDDYRSLPTVAGAAK